MVIEKGPSGTEKGLMIGLAVLMVAFIISIPFMVRDGNKRREELWQAHGCQMYDNYMQDKLPAKCATFFTDHYAPQERRTQPQNN